jgi:hypothetical protein
MKKIFTPINNVHAALMETKIFKYAFMMEIIANMLDFFEQVKNISTKQDEEKFLSTKDILGKPFSNRFIRLGKIDLDLFDKGLEEFKQAFKNV